MNLPYSVIRGEIVAIPVVVYNYMNKDLTVEVLLENNNKEFEFAEVSNEVHDNKRMFNSFWNNFIYSLYKNLFCLILIFQRENCIEQKKFLFRLTLLRVFLSW